MADRRDFYFQQLVTEGEIDGAFDGLEQADWDLASDVGIFGIISGLVATQHSPVADLSIDLTGPGRAYDASGRRIYVATAQTVSLATDENGVSTDPGDGKDRWVAVFVRFDRALSDERVDGNSQAVYFQRNESFEFVVRQGAAADTGEAVRVALDDSMVLVCDVLRSVPADPQPGEGTTIENAAISISRRQAFVFADSSAISIDQDNFAGQDTIDATTVEGALLDLATAADTSLDRMDAHVGGTAEKHASTAITTAATGWLGGATVAAQLAEIVTDLASTSVGVEGASRIGVGTLTGTASYAPVPGPLMDVLVAMHNQIKLARTDMPRLMQTIFQADHTDGSTVVFELNGTPDFCTIRIANDDGAGIEYQLVVSPLYYIAADETWKVSVRNDSAATLDYNLHVWGRVP